MECSDISGATYAMYEGSMHRHVLAYLSVTSRWLKAGRMTDPPEFACFAARCRAVEDSRPGTSDVPWCSIYFKTVLVATQSRGLADLLTNAPNSILPVINHELMN